MTWQDQSCSSERVRKSGPSASNSHSLLVRAVQCVVLRNVEEVHLEITGLLDVRNVESRHKP